MKQNQIAGKIAYEKKVVGQMVKVFCQGHKHLVSHKGTTLCTECQETLDYAHQQIDRCPVMETKTFCSACKIHCYKPQIRERIRRIMSYSGPRMLLYHPITAIRHLWRSKEFG